MTTTPYTSQHSCDYSLSLQIYDTAFLLFPNSSLYLLCFVIYCLHNCFSFCPSWLYTIEITFIIIICVLLAIKTAVLFMQGLKAVTVWLIRQMISYSFFSVQASFLLCMRDIAWHLNVSCSHIVTGGKNTFQQSIKWVVTAHLPTFQIEGYQQRK